MIQLVMVPFLLAILLATILILSTFYVSLSSSCTKMEQRRQQPQQHEHFTVVMDLEQHSVEISSPQQQPQSSLDHNDIPLVIISALRPDYLEQFLMSLDNQIATTPTWIASKQQRYLLVHRHKHNDINKNYHKMKLLAKKYKLQLHTFTGLHFPKLTMKLNTNYVWYKMMKFVFTTLKLKEVLIADEDIVMAPDALLTAAKLFQEKQQRIDIHNIVLGSWNGDNRINGHPYTYLAVRSLQFQTMLYSMNSTFFEQIETAKKDSLLYNLRPYKNTIDDWKEEIMELNFIVNLTQLTPSVGRMYYRNGKGMEQQPGGGRTSTQQQVEEEKPWDYWNTAIYDSSKTLKDYYLEPSEVTDVFGFICLPIQPICGYHYNLLRRGKDDDTTTSSYIVPNRNGFLINRTITLTP